MTGLYTTRALQSQIASDAGGASEPAIPTLLCVPDVMMQQFFLLRP